MKAIIALMFVIAAGSAVQANTSLSVEKQSIPAFEVLGEDEVKAGWIQLPTICYRSSSYNGALKACEGDTKLLGLLTNDNVVFQSSCRISTACQYGFDYELISKMLVVK